MSTRESPTVETSWASHIALNRRFLNTAKGDRVAAADAIYAPPRPGPACPAHVGPETTPRRLQDGSFRRGVVSFSYIGNSTPRARARHGPEASRTVARPARSSSERAPD